VLLAKTLRSTTFKLALICIAVFGAVMFALLGYVYWSTASYIHSRTDNLITAELAYLRQTYDERGRGGLMAAMGQHHSMRAFESNVYSLVDSSFTPLAGNLDTWPAYHQRQQRLG
jgi:hypothetical protein